jgi:DNA repair protein RadA
MDVEAEVLEPGILKGVASRTITKLLKAGFPTLKAVAVTPPRELAERAGMGKNTALKVNRLARLAVDSGFESAADMMEKLKEVNKCVTGSTELDRILCGGIETSVITELIGEYSTGKTQICFTLSVLSQLHEEDGGLNGNVCFIDTEGTFIPERVKQIAETREMDADEILSNIYVARAYNSHHQISLIETLPDICMDENIRLVVVDSMIGHFRSEYIGRGNLAERQQKLAHCLGSLLRLAEAFNLAVVITNQVQANPKVMFGDPNSPTGGHVMAHACNHRVFIRNGRKNTSLVRVIDSPTLPEEKIRIAITEKGIEDP